ncbi:hypothetical protein OS493_016875 [Desmophyllum pertusum]|uniref:MD-2-related lipid-recognition domain-containing protein n=1 Tax=Desmophyllum pertusum TaxID=174260 RepID=A0A9W9YNL8_9CNID|nr:hypothetical protein OS493_016875 [Desmophyllum pertusum]
MILTNQLLPSIALCLLFCVISVDTKFPAGVEFKELKLCGPHDETARIKISPWPFIPSGKPSNISVTFTPAVDVLAATIQWKLISESDGRILASGIDNFCRFAADFCSLPAGETFVWTYCDLMRAIPPGIQITVRGVLELYNEDHKVFFCLDAVATIH